MKGKRERVFEASCGWRGGTGGKRWNSKGRDHRKGGRQGFPGKRVGGKDPGGGWRSTHHEKKAIRERELTCSGA